MSRHNAGGVTEQPPETLPVTGPVYLYAIVRGPAGWQPGGCGIGGAQLSVLAKGGLAAVVSPLPHTTRVRPERRNLAAHQQVLTRLMEEQAVLPVSFGTVAASPADVLKFVTANQKPLAERLERVAGKVEMGLRVNWDVPNIFEYFVDRHAELQQARDDLFGAQHEPTHDEKLALGRLFEGLRDREREAHFGRVEEALSLYCADLKRNPCRRDNDVMDLACLVARPHLADFEEAVFAAARHFDNSFAFDYNGPWPPYHFVELDIRV